MFKDMNTADKAAEYSAGAARSDGQAGSAGSSTGNANREHRQVDKWIAGGVALAVVYSLCRLSYSTALVSPAMIGIFVLAITGTFAVVVTCLFGRPRQTGIFPVQVIQFFPFRYSIIWCREKSNLATRTFLYGFGGLWIVVDYSCTKAYVLGQSDADDIWLLTALVFQFAAPLWAGWFLVRQISLRDEWLWVKIAARFLIPFSFLLDVFLHGHRLFTESEDIMERLAYFWLLLLHFWMVMLTLSDKLAAKYGRGLK